MNTLKSQQGSSVIVVMILLVIITFIGTIAIRQGLVSLNLATNSQAQSLLMQSSDALYTYMENPVELGKNMTAVGMFGMVKPESFIGKELVFCYRPTLYQNLFNLKYASIIYWPDTGGVGAGATAPTNDDIGTEGYCKIDDYNSGRKAVLTQVAIQRSITPTVIPFQFTPRGTDVEGAKLDEMVPIKVTVTSILPNLSGASDTAIESCFKNKTNEVTVGHTTEQTVTDCLAQQNVPMSTQVMDYALLQYVVKS